MLDFAEAVADGARFVPVNTSGAGKQKLWATPDRNRGLRVVVINKDSASAGDVTVTAGAKFLTATVKRLEAPDLGATRGISWAGRTFDGTPDGNPLGELHEEKLPATADGAHFRVAPASAALVTVTP